MRRAIRVSMMLACIMVLFSCPESGAAYPSFSEVRWLALDRQTSAALPRFGDETGPTSRIALLVTVSPGPDAYFYAGRSQAGSLASTLGAETDGRSIASHVLFPPGKKRPDPVSPGRTVLAYDRDTSFLVPVPTEPEQGQEVKVRFSGLLCTAVNCTPFTLDAAATFSGAPERNPEWVTSYFSGGTAEPIKSLTPQKVQDLPAFPRLGLNAPESPTQVRPSFDLADLRPVPFSPGLEVRSLGKAIVLGFLAGLILNIMPCVLPVLAVKTAALLQSAREPGKTGRFRRHQLFFALGILAWFAALAGLMHWLGLAWGQLFQSPAVTVVMAVGLLLLALNLFGVLTLPVFDFRTADSSRPDIQAFVTGLTCTLLATPCGGPLLGGVVGWAMTQPLGSLALTLGAMGLGMAFPYLLLAAFPGLAAVFPRPGRWMLAVEKLLGFLLLGTVAYLVSFLAPEVIPAMLGSLVVAALGGWLWGCGARAAKRTGLWALRAAAVACVALAIFWPLSPRPGPTEWLAYSPDRLAEELTKGPVLVNFTAAWCPTCKVVEATALAEGNVGRWRRDYGLSMMRVDITQPNPEGEALLKALGSASIPLIAVFPAGPDANSPLVLRDVVTGGQVEAAVKKVTGR